MKHFSVMLTAAFGVLIQFGTVFGHDSPGLVQDVGTRSSSPVTPNDLVVRSSINHGHSTASCSGKEHESRGNTSITDAMAFCLHNQYVPYLTAADGELWVNATKAFNLRFHFTPAIVVLPGYAEHVATAVNCASHGAAAILPPGDFPIVKVQARSGGHSYAAFGLGGQDGSMVIDLKRLDQVSVDETGLATVGGGVRIGDLAQQLYAQGMWGMPHGTCPGIGVGGHVTHGGYGYSSRSWGLSLDTIVDMEVVLANGSVVNASTTSYPELYYALKGAADSFGIVTAFRFQTHKAPKSVVNFNYNFDLMNVTNGATPDSATTAFLHLQEVARNASVIDRRNSWGMFIGVNTFLVRGVYNGTADDPAFKAFESELLRGLPEPLSVNTSNLSWMENNILLGGNPDGTFNPPPPGAPGSSDTFFAKSAVTPESSPLTEATLRHYFSYLQVQGSNSSAGSWFSIVNLYGGPDSQINAHDSGASAYPDRNALWVFQHYSSTGDRPFTQAAYDFVTGMNDALEYGRTDSNFEAYVNYVDPSYGASMAQAYYYGDAVTQKLQQLKCEFDPKNVFFNPQAFVCSG